MEYLEELEKEIKEVENEIKKYALDFGISEESEETVDYICDRIMDESDTAEYEVGYLQGLKRAVSLFKSKGNLLEIKEEK